MQDSNINKDLLKIAVYSEKNRPAEEPLPTGQLHARDNYVCET